MKRLEKKPTRLLCAYLIAAISLAAVLRYYLYPPQTRSEACDLILAAVIPRFFVAAILLVLIAYYDENLLAFPRVSWKNLLWCIPPLAVVLVNFPYSALAGGTAHLTHAQLLPLFLFKCFLIGASEEWLFRGIIFNSLNRASKERGASCFNAVLFSSLIFGAFHLINLLEGADILSVFMQCGYSFLIGAMLAVVYLKTENLWIPVFLHTVFDIGGFLVSDLGEGQPQDLTFWVLTAVTGLICAVHIILTLVRMIKKASSK